MEWNGIESNRIESNGIEWNGMESGIKSVSSHTHAARNSYLIFTRHIRTATGSGRRISR